jgi:acyl dehydratase
MQIPMTKKEREMRIAPAGSGGLVPAHETMAKEHKYLEDYDIGETIVSPWRTITETDIVNFAGITGDWHPLHTDKIYAGTGPFGERIAHGMLSLSIGMALPFRLGPYSSYLPESFIALYGLEDVRFTKPTRIGDTIKCEVKVIEITEKDKTRGVISTQHSIMNQKGELLISYTLKILCGKKP